MRTEKQMCSFEDFFLFTEEITKTGFNDGPVRRRYEGPRLTLIKAASKRPDLITSFCSNVHKEAHLFTLITKLLWKRVGLRSGSSETRAGGNPNCNPKQ